jgi:hypothetical protein
MYTPQLKQTRYQRTYLLMVKILSPIGLIQPLDLAHVDENDGLINRT